MSFVLVFVILSISLKFSHLDNHLPQSSFSPIFSFPQRLAESLARTVPLNKYVNGFSKTMVISKSSAAPSRTPSARHLGQKAQRAPRSVPAVQQPRAQANVRGPARRTASKKQVWVPYAVKKLREGFNPWSDMSKRSNIAQMLNQVRALEEDLYDRNPAVFRPYSAPNKDGRPRYQKMPPIEHLPLTSSEEQLSDYSYAASANASQSRIKRLQESRRKKHLARLDQHRQLVLKIDRDLEQKVGEVGNSMRRLVDHSDADTQRLMDGLKDELLGPLSESDLVKVREEVGQSFLRQEKAIMQLESRLMNIEDRRAKLVHDAIRHTASDLIEIAHMLPDEVERLFQDEVKEVNIHIIRNQGSYQELLARLGISLVKKQEQAKEQYRERKARWRTLRHSHTIEKFKEKMQSDEIVKPPERRELFDKLMLEMESFEKAAMKKIKSLLQMLPPYIKSDEVQEITETLQALYIQSDQASDGIIQSLTELENKMDEQCWALLDDLREDLKNIGAKSDEEVDAEVQESCLPLVEARHESVAGLIERCGARMYDEQQRFMKKIDKFSTFFLKSARAWEVYVSEVTEANEDMTEKLAQRFDEYDDTKNDLEAELKGYLEELAQEPSKQALDDKLEVIREVLGPAGAIEENHRSYTRESVDMCKAFPPALSYLIDGHLAAVGQLFGVQPEAVFLEEQAGENASKAGSEGEEALKKKKGGKSAAEEKARLEAAAAVHSHMIKVHARFLRLPSNPRMCAYVCCLLVKLSGLVLWRSFLAQIATKTNHTARSTYNSCPTHDNPPPDSQEQAARLEELKMWQLDVSGHMFMIKTDIEELAVIVTEGTEAEREAERKSEQPEGDEAAEEDGAEAKEEAKEEEPVSARGKKGGKKKSKKELEAERLKAEEEAEAKRLAEVKAAKEKAEREKLASTIPVDTDGKECIRVIKFDMELLIEQLPSIRHAFLKQAQDFGTKNNEGATEFSNTRVTELTKDLHLILREHRPRMARVEIDVYDPRRQQLEANLERFKRYELRLVMMIQAEDDTFHQMYETALNELATFVARIAELRTKVDSAKSLASLQKHNKAAKKAKLDLMDSYQQRIYDIEDLLADLEEKTDSASAVFKAGCLLIGSENAGGVVGVWSEEEVAYYHQLVEELTLNRNQVLESQRQKLEELDEKAKADLDLSNFEQNFKEVVEELSVMEGFGHKYGEPKRNMTMRIREEFAKNENAIQQIGALLRDLRAECKSQQWCVALLDHSNPPAAATRPAKHGLQDIPADEKDTTVVKIFQLVNELRARLLERANYLQVLREDLEGLVELRELPLVPVPLKEIAFEQEEVQEPEESARGKKGKGAAAGKKDAKGAAAKKDAKGKADGENGVEEKASETLLGIVEEANLTCRREMTVLFKEYDASHPDRKRKGSSEGADEAPASPAKGKKGAPAAKEETLVELPPAIDAHCKREIQRAQQKREEYITQFRKDVDSVSETLADCAKVILADIVWRCNREAAKRCQEVEEAFKAEYSELQTQLRTHLSRLKPSLENRDRAELVGLKEMEERRVEKVKAAITQYRQQLLQCASEGAARYTTRMVHVIKVALQLFDTCLYPSDLVPADEENDVGERKPLAGMVREYNRQHKEFLEGKADKEGVRFSMGDWPGVRYDGLLIPAGMLGKQQKEEKEQEQSAGAKDAKDAKAGKGGKGKEAEAAPADAAIAAAGEVEALPLFSPAVRGFKIKPNRAVLAARVSTPQPHPVSLYSENSFLSLFMETIFRAHTHTYLLVFCRTKLTPTT